MNSPTQTTPPSSNKGKSENQLVNLAFNIIIPTLILMKLSGDDYLGTKLAIVIALSFPLIYGLKDFLTQRKFNFFSILGIVSILLTGGISLLELDPAYIAIKEAAVPAALGIATVISLKTPYPLVKTFLYNDTILQTDRIAEALDKNNNNQPFEKCL